MTWIFQGVTNSTLLTPVTINNRGWDKGCNMTSIYYTNTTLSNLNFSVPRSLGWRQRVFNLNIITWKYGKYFVFEWISSKTLSKLGSLINILDNAYYFANLGEDNINCTSWMLSIFHGHPVCYLLTNDIKENHDMFFKCQILRILKPYFMFQHLYQHLKAWSIHADFVEKPIRVFIKQFYHILMDHSH